MSGMGGGPLSINNSMIVSAFQSSLLHQLLVVLVVLAIVAVAWEVLRGKQLRRAVARRQLGTLGTELTPTAKEPPARRLLRVGFGLIWLLDGILQAQSAMPVGLATQVIQPTASSSPTWVQHLVNTGVLIWNDHPVVAAVAAVWVQVGIGLWLLVAPRGRWSQAAAIMSIGWGLVVWGFGEAFGGIFAPGLTILFGAPGAVLIYCLAGGLVALPERVWSSARIGRLILVVMGAFFAGMALLQAWPGRGFWQGELRGHPTGMLVGMVDAMAGTPQPGLLSGWVRSFGSFDAAHGFAVNLFVVIVLGALGVAFCSSHRRVVQLAMYAGCLFCLADWVLIEDFGFFGGLGTDPNSMIPIALVIVAGYLALVQPTVQVDRVESASKTRPSFRERLSLDQSYAFRTVAATGAVLVVLLGAVPMALASTNPKADPIVTEATNGTPDVTNIPAPSFALTDQEGRSVSLEHLRGKTIALTFLDPVCTTDCPLIGQEFRAADLQLGARAKDTEFIAIVANPLYRSSFYTEAFDRDEGLNHLSNWLFLTGSVRALSATWDNYGVQVNVSPAGAMVDHSDIAYVIDRRGHTRYVLSADPGAGTAATQSSFVTLLDQELSSAMSP